MSSSPVPAGWPVVAPPSRLFRWFVGVGCTALAAMIAVALVVGFEVPTSPLRSVAVAVGLAMSASGCVAGVWMAARGSPARTVVRGAPPQPVPLSGFRRLRRALLAGEELGPDDRYRVAAHLARVPMMWWMTTCLGVVTGGNLLAFAISADGAGSAFPILLIIVSAVPVAMVLVLAGMMLWFCPAWRAASAAGALPALRTTS